MQQEKLTTPVKPVAEAKIYDYDPDLSTPSNSTPICTQFQISLTVESIAI